MRKSSMNKNFNEKEILRWKGFSHALLQADPPTGLTPRIPVWKKNKATLWYYPPKQKTFNTPLFIVYSLVNQPFILDLAPDLSLIEAFVNEGYEVYLMDFGIPGYEDKDTDVDSYVVDYLQAAVRRALRHSKAEEISIMGTCVGGTLAAMYVAMAEEPIKNLIISVSPLDSSEPPFFDKWAKAVKDGKADFNRLIDAMGILPAWSIKYGMRMVTAPVYFSHYLSLLNRSYDEKYVNKWMLFNKWTVGHIPFTGAAMKQMLNDLGKENKLINNKMTIRGKSAALSNIKCSVLVISTDLDRLVPRALSERVMDVVSSEDKNFVLLPGGHAKLTENGRLPDYIEDWLPERSNPNPDYKKKDKKKKKLKEIFTNLLDNDALKGNA